MVRPEEGGYWPLVGREAKVAARHSVMHSKTPPPAPAATRRSYLVQNVSGAEVEKLFFFFV